MPVLAVIVLAVGTYAIRASGPLLAGRYQLSKRTQRLLTLAATLLLVALAATEAIFDGTEFVGWARPAGVLVGGLLAWRKAPFVVVVVAAAGTAAGLRALGVG